MLATLDRPIVTDYVPAAKPPWLLLAVLVGVVLVGLPRDLLPTALAASLGVIFTGWLVNWLWARSGSHRSEPRDSGVRTEPADESPRRAA